MKIPIDSVPIGRLPRPDDFPAGVKPPAVSPTARSVPYVTAVVEAAREHRSHCVDIIKGVTFRVRNPEQVIARWPKQIEMLNGLK